MKTLEELREKEKKLVYLEEHHRKEIKKHENLAAECRKLTRGFATDLSAVRAEIAAAEKAEAPKEIPCLWAVCKLCGMIHVGMDSGDPEKCKPKYVCGVPGCPFCCPENNEPQFCPPIKNGDMVTVRNHEYLAERTFRFCKWTGCSLMLLFKNGGHFFVEPGDVISHKWINGPCGFTQRFKCKFVCAARCPHA